MILWDEKQRRCRFRQIYLFQLTATRVSLFRCSGVRPFFHHSRNRPLFDEGFTLPSYNGNLSEGNCQQSKTFEPFMRCHVVMCRTDATYRYGLFMQTLSQLQRHNGWAKSDCCRSNHATDQIVNGVRYNAF